MPVISSYDLVDVDVGLIDVDVDVGWFNVDGDGWF